MLCLIPFYIFQLFVKLLCSSILLHFFEHLCDCYIESFPKLLIDTSFEVSPCSFIWNMFLCLLILPDSLCLFLCIRYAGYIS